MKKTLLVTLAAIIALAMLLSGCANPPPAATQTASPQPTQTATETTPAAAAGTVKTGLGQDISIAKSASASTDAEGKPVNALAQTDCLMAAVTLDAEGKIAGIQVDSAQVKINIDAAGKLVTDPGEKPQTKMELGEKYGMKKASSIGKEWSEQAAALGQWMIGKTVDEIMSMKTYKKDEAHPAVPQEPDLTSSVTISVEGFLKAVQEAAANAKDFGVQPVGKTKTGLGTDISIAKSTSATTDQEGKKADALGQADIIMAAVTVDETGKIIGVIIDNAQVKINVDATGKLTTDTKAEPKTKVELGDEYGMKKASSIGKEWYEQAAALGQWMIGKTINQVLAMKTAKKDDAHPNVPQEADLTSSVTISVEGYLNAVKKAVANAK